MRSIVTNNANLNNGDMVVKINDYLKDKYSSRFWFVMVYNDVSGFDNHCFSGRMHSLFRESGKNVVSYSTQFNTAGDGATKFINHQVDKLDHYFFDESKAGKWYDFLVEAKTHPTDVGLDLEMQKLENAIEFAGVKRGNGLEATWSSDLDVKFDNYIYSNSRAAS